MGVWSEEPAGNDLAQDWINDVVTYPLLEAVRDALRRFLDDPADDVRKANAEVGIALLIDLCANTKLKYVALEIAPVATEMKLWLMAANALELLLKQNVWLSAWTNPEKKRAVLQQLLNEIQSIANRSTSYDQGEGVERE